MKQVTQRLRDGKIEVLDVPPPLLTPATLIVDVRASLLSAGTERTKVETARKSLLGKARARPDQVKQVLEKARRDGLSETIQAVRSRLGEPSALGYSTAGIVVAVGDRVSDLQPGDLVACGGGDYAVHAEIDRVPANLCVPVPKGVDFAQASFATVGSIALHGVRQADVHLGERVGVIGLGLVGQLAARILRAAGCTVVGIDLSPELVELARRCGVREAFVRSDAPTRGDCDAVVIAAATSSSDPVELAAELCRDRGRVVVVGDVGMKVPRPAYYEKELELRVSRSYGPGRYDREYEERGLDYPIGYVRWTERRNMAAFLELVASGQVEVEALINERVSVDQAAEAYERLVGAERSPLGIVLEYEPGPELAQRAPAPAAAKTSSGAGAVGVIGTGSFAARILIPGLQHAGFQLLSVASSSGLSARAAADRTGARAVQPAEIIGDPAVGLVAIATRHNSHASLAAEALGAGKAVFVEKPPALNDEELEALRRVRAESGGLLAVGFNRRFAPLAAELRDHLSGEPFELVYRINPGPLPGDHWLDDPEEGGGRLLGEGCHFVDFACWFADSVPEQVSASMLAEPGRPLAAARGFTVLLDFGARGRATIVYVAEGASSLEKEYVEAHAGGRSAALHDFRVLELHGAGRKRTRKSGGGKGHDEQFAALRRWTEGAAQEGPDPLDTMAATLAALRSAQTGEAVRVP